jgi:polyhydroxyalkanoate synthase
VGAQQVIPPEAMQQYFWLLDPWSPVRRLMAYGKETNPGKLAYMTALERWLWDGLGLDGPIAREMLFELYADNRPMRGQWVIGGTAITPGALTMPLWVAITQKDVLVPPASSLPVLGQAKGASVVTADTGHVGLVCGRRAKAAFYDPLTAWLKG